MPWENRRHDDVPILSTIHLKRKRTPLFPPASLGVIGSGQLGRMFIQAAQRMGYRVGVLSATEEAPAAQVANWTVIGPPDHLPALEEFAERAEAVTVEFENVSAPALRWLARRSRVRPGWRTLWICQNRLREKRFLARHGFLTPPGGRFVTRMSLGAAVRDLGLPLILKTAASGYDGKGQVLVEQASSALGAWASLGRAPCVAEAWVDFAVEVSVVVARGADGRAVCYPVALNRHERHILDSTLMPAPLGPSRRAGSARAGTGGGPGAGYRRRLDRRVLSDR